MGGLAIGCGYVCAITTLVKWFPHRKGLVTGVAVAGYGSGAIFVSALIESLLSSGWGVLDVVRSIGLICGPIVLVGGLMMFVPPGDGEQVATFDRRKLLRDRRFWTLFLAFLLGNLPGLMIIGNLKPIGLSMGNSLATAGLAISVLAVGNTLGRVVWGYLFDHLGGRRSVIASLCLILISVLAMLMAGDCAWAFLGASLLVGLGFASCLVLYAAEVAKRYGSAVMGSVYSVVLLAHGIAAMVGAPLGGLSRDRTGSFMPALVAAAVFAAAGLGVYLLLDRSQSPTPGGHAGRD